MERTVSPASETSTPLLGRQAQTIIACNQKLQELGIDNTIRLPQIVVVGDQSTGKSSLIEALSQVKVPKAKGCCTQCPLAINLSSGPSESAPWTCSIFIEEQYYFDKSLVGKNITKTNPFGPWQRLPDMKVVKIKTTTDKDEVPNLIRAAQAAVLNPGSRHEDYLDPNMQREASQANESTMFSPNVIRLDISEGGWTNLSFIDLPGVIANTGKEKNKYLVKLIKNLVQHHAAADRSVNMLTLPMTHDIENSQAYAIVQELKAESRTLAVLTKADLADDDQRAQFLTKFTGSDELEFEHGYHFVVMPDNMEPQKARAFEAQVFNQNPWLTLDRRHRARLGVTSLRDYLRDLLFQKTAEALPGNLSSIKDRLLAVDTELAALPAPPNAVLLPLQLQQSVTHFENAMRTMLIGSNNYQNASAQNGWLKTSARNEWSNAAAKFKDSITKARPTLYLMSTSEQNRLNDAQKKIASARNGSVNDAVELSSGDENASALPTKPETLTTAPLDPVHRFRFEEIRSINQHYYQACVPGEIEIRAVEAMNRTAVEYWHSLLDHFMNENSRLLNRQVIGVVEQSFEQYGHLRIHEVIIEFVKAFVNEAIHAEWTSAESLCRLEQRQPFTYDDETLKKKEAQLLQERLEKRMQQRLKLKKVEKEASGIVSNKLKRKNDDDLESDPFQTELLMSVKNKAYYEVASVRFVDNVCMGIFGRLLPACTERLVEELKVKLGLYDPTKHQQIVEWMAEDPNAKAKRRQLIREKKRLHEGHHYITEILGSNTANPANPARRPRASDSPDDPITPSKRKKINHVSDDDAAGTVVTLTPNRISNRLRNVALSPRKD